MKISEHFHRKSLDLHHAYIIEGPHSEVVPEVLEILEGYNIKTRGNPDFFHIEVDSFKIEDARNLKSLSTEKAVTDGLPAQAGRKIFLISTNNFLLEAQNTLLKMFEEPIPNTHFFLVLPDINVLLPTFTSRFYIVQGKDSSESKEAAEFLKSSVRLRIEFLKELTTEKENEENAIASSRAKALRFLNNLEKALHKKNIKDAKSVACFKQIFKARQFLRQPGSSLKSLMESVALIAPNF